MVPPSGESSTFWSTALFPPALPGKTAAVGLDPLVPMVPMVRIWK